MAQQRLVDFLAEAFNEKRAVDWTSAVLPRITHESAREKDGEGQLPLHCAAQNQAPLEVVDSLLKAYPEGAREKDGNGRLPFQVNELLKIYEQYRSEGRTADAAVLQQLFFRSVEEGDVKSFNSLLKLGVDVNQCDDEGITPAYIAALHPTKLGGENLWTC